MDVAADGEVEAALGDGDGEEDVAVDGAVDGNVDDGEAEAPLTDGRGLTAVEGEGLAEAAPTADGLTGDVAPPAESLAELLPETDEPEEAD